MLNLVGKCFVGMTVRSITEKCWELSLVLNWLEDTFRDKYLRIIGSLKVINEYICRLTENMMKPILMASKDQSGRLLVLKFTKGGTVGIKFDDLDLSTI